MHKINLFEPYRPDSLLEKHENRLTWAYLALMKYVPLVRSAFIDVLRTTNGASSNCEIPSFTELESLGYSLETQRSDFEEQRPKIARNKGLLFSVLITDEPRQDQDEVGTRHSKAIYDGVLTFGNDWVFVVENKPFHAKTSMTSDQLSPFLPGDHQFEIQNQPLKLLWRDLINPLHVLIEEQLVDSTSRIMIEDFLEYLLAEYPQLNPFHKFGVCKNHEYLLNRRCQGIMINAAGVKRVQYHRGFQHKIKLDWGAATDVFLYSDGGTWDKHIGVSIFPGNTVIQAREFFSNVDRQQFLELQRSNDNQAKWEISTDLHFAAFAKNLVWGQGNIGVESFFDYWCQHQDQIKQYNRDDGSFKYLFEKLKDLGMIIDGDLSELNRHFESTKRPSINICPGFGLVHRWDLQHAIKLDDDGKFVDDFKQRINEALSTWGQQLPAELNLNAETVGV